MLFAPLVDEVRWLAVAVFITAFRPIPLFDAYTTVKSVCHTLNACDLTGLYTTYKAVV